MNELRGHPRPSRAHRGQDGDVPPRGRALSWKVPWRSTLRAGSTTWHRPFILSLLYISIASAFMYLLLAVWLSMHASICSHSFGVRILTRLRAPAGARHGADGRDERKAGGLRAPGRAGHAARAGDRRPAALGGAAAARHPGGPE